MTYAIDATPPFYHGPRADLKVGDLLAPGFNSNYREQKLSWIYFSASLDAAIWGCELGPKRGARADLHRRADRRIFRRSQPHRQEVPRQPDQILSLSISPADRR